MKIVFLDQMTIGDFDRTGFEQLGEVVTYPTTDETEIDDSICDYIVSLIENFLYQYYFF